MIRLFAGHPNAANIVMALLLVLGMVSVGQIVRSTFPKLPLDLVQVRVVYPGASTGEVHDSVCLLLEDAVDTIDQVEEYRCESRPNLATLTVEARDGASVDRLLADVRTQVDAIDELPPQTEPPVTELLGTTEPVVSIALSGDLPYPVMKDLAEETRRKLKQLDGVSRVLIDGFSDRQIRIQLDQQTLQSLGLSIVDVASLVRSLNIDVPAGELDSELGTLALRVEDERTTTAGIADLRIRVPSGGQDIRLGDIASIADTFEYPNRRIRFDGRPGAILHVQKNRSDDALDVLAEVERFVEGQNAANSGIELTLTRNLASLVSDRLTMLIKNGLQGLVLVILTLWLFFSARHALWVAMGLPVSFAGAIFLMRATGYQFDMMTLVALLIAIGIIVDDAIVVSENIAVKREQGLGAVDASVEGTLEVMPGVLASFLTTFAVFLPMAFLSGDIGAILSVVPVILLMTLAVSLVEAFLILPRHLVHTRIEDNRHNRAQAWLDARLDELRDRCISLVETFVEWRYLGLGSLVGVLLLTGSLVGSGVIGFTPLPELDNESIEARLLMSPGTPIARTEATVEHILDTLRQVNAELTPEQPGGQPLVRHVAVQYGQNVDAYVQGDHVATIVVDLLDPEIRSVTSSEVRERWREATGSLPDVVFLKYADPVIGPQGKPIEMRVAGESLEQIEQAGAELLAWLARYPGVDDLSMDLRPGQPEYRYRLRPGAQALGVTSAALAEQLRGAFNGLIAQEFQVGEERFEVAVQLTASSRRSFNTLDTFMVQSTSGTLVPLAEVAERIEGRGYSRILRVDGRPVATVEGLIDFDLATSAEIVADTQARFIPELQRRYPGSRVTIEGESAQAGETLGSLRQGFALGFFAMFLLLAIQFRSYIEPLVVVVIIPMSMIGVVLGHLLLGYDLTMPSLLGFVSLAGIVVNDSILLVTFVEKRIGEGMELFDAVVRAARDRFRAILLTSLTTIVGLLPLLTETSMQAKVVIPLAISLAFGLTTATMLILFVIPAFYMVLYDAGLFHRHESLKQGPAGVQLQG